MDVIGENWDVAIYHQLLVSPPPPNKTEADRQLHVINVIVETLGDSLVWYLKENLPKIQTVIYSMDGDIVHRVIESMAQYYLLMNEVICGKSPHNFSGWRHSTEYLRDRLNVTPPSIFITFQLGLPLLIPLMVASSQDRAVRVLAHSQNEFARQIYKSAGSQLDVFMLESATPFEYLNTLRTGGHLIANIDTAYPGTRIKSLNILDGWINIPAGFLALAKRTGAKIRAIALPFDNDKVSIELGEEIDPRASSDNEIMVYIRDFFEPLLRSYPEQWLAWSSLVRE